MGLIVSCVGEEKEQPLQPLKRRRRKKRKIGGDVFHSNESLVSR